MRKRQADVPLLRVFWRLYVVSVSVSKLGQARERSEDSYCAEVWPMGYCCTDGWKEWQKFGELLILLSFE